MSNLAASLVRNSLNKGVNRISIQFFPVFHNVVAVQSCFYSTPAVSRRKRPISRAMKAYFEKAQLAETNYIKASEEYKVGKRILANMMGEDPETFTQKDVDKAIEYLLPSGLFVVKARPMMKPAEELYPRLSKPVFDFAGRPHHYLFYTTDTSYFEFKHEATRQIMNMDKLQDNLHATGRTPVKEDKFAFDGLTWLPLHEMKTKLERFKLSQEMYDSMILLLDRMVAHPMSAHITHFLKEYYKPVKSSVLQAVIEEPKMGEDGRAYVIGAGSKLRAQATVKVISPGTGKININDTDLSYFSVLQSREQVLFPLVLTGLIDKVDIEATITGRGGQSGDAGAVRLALSKALQSFVDEQMREKMNIAGLLTWDRRVKERMKPGQEGARRKYTWLKR